MVHGSVNVSTTTSYRVKDMINQMKEGARPPSYKITAKFEKILKSAFVHTQGKTHVLTGSLKASGHSSSDFDGEEWSGTIMYGGPLFGSAAPGPPNDPVDYAIYEQARGGAHDFLGGLEVYEEKFEAAVNSFFPG